jgi:ADP-heptose:LPS heptosyltransferase
MKNILIAPWARPLRTKVQNSKNYPYWHEVVASLRQLGHETIQIGVSGEPEIGADKFEMNLGFTELASLIYSCDTWIAVDSFFQHYATSLKKNGIVIWSKSSPKIFGYESNINLLKDEKYLRPDMFGIWESCVFDKDAFIEPSVVIDAVKNLLLRTVIFKRN